MTCRSQNFRTIMKRIIFQTFFALFLIQLGAYAQTTSWKGTSNTDWNRAANWTAGVPTASVDAIIGDASFTGNNQPDLSASSVCKSLTIGTGTKVSTLKVDKALTVNGNITMGPNGTINHTAATIIGLKGNWSNGGKYTAGNNKANVAFSGTTQSLTGATNSFRILTINAGSTTALGGNVVVVSQLTVSGTLDPGESPSFTISGAGKLTVNAGGKLLVKNPTFSGNFASTGTIALNAGSTVDYAALSVNQTVDTRFTYGTLRISGGQTKTLAGNLLPLNATLATSGNLNVAGGTLDLSSFTANRGTNVLGGTITVADGATLKIGGTNTFPARYQTHLLAQTSTVEYSGTSQTVSLEAYGNLTLSSSSGAVVKTMPASPLTLFGTLRSGAGTGTSVSFTARSSLTVNGSVVLGSSTTFNGTNFSHSVGGNWSNDGTFNSTGSVTLSGGGAVISGGGVNNFSDLTLSGANITAATGTGLNVVGNFSTSGAGTFTHLSGGSGAVTLSGSAKTISGTGILFNHLAVTGTIGTARSLGIAGNLTVNGSFSATAGTITMTGAAKTISGAGAIAFNGLSVPGSVSTTNGFSLNAAFSVPGSFTATAGTAAFVGSSTLSGTANLFNVAINGTKLQLGASAVLGVAGAFTITAGTLDTTSTVPNTVNYNSPSIQSVASAVYHNLTLSGNGTKLAAGALTINGDLTVSPGTIFSPSLNNVSLLGNWINQGTFQAGTSAVALLGGLDTSVSGATTFSTLTINKSGSNSVVRLNNNVGVANLRMTSGTLLTGPNSVTITSNRFDNGIILGTIARIHPFLPNTSYAFEGPNNTITFSSLVQVSSVTVTVTRSSIADFPFGGSVNRQFVIGLEASGPYAATLRLHYEDSDLNGNNESNMQLWRYGALWSAAGKTANDTANNWVEQDAVTDLSGRWTLSDDVNAVRWLGSVSTAWETPANWIVIQGNPNLPPSTNDVADLGTAPFVNEPIITTPVTVKGVLFGSGEPLNLTLGAGGSLTTKGNINGAWSNDAAHTILVGSQALTVGGNLALSDGTNGHSINLIISTGSVKVGDTLTEAGDAYLINAGSGNLSIGGNFIYNGGIFVAGSGTVAYNGSAAQVVAGGITYNNLSFDKPTGTATLTNSATVSGNFVVTNSGTFAVKAPLAISKNVTVYTNATLDADSSTISLRGDWNRVGTFTAGNSTVEFNGSGPQSITPTTFNHLKINKPAGIATLAGDITINGDLILAAGELDLGGFSADRSVVGGTLTLGDGTHLSVGNRFPENFNARNVVASSTVSYYGTGPQNVEDGIYGNLYFFNGGAQAKTLTGPTTALGDLLIEAGATLDGGSLALQVQGDWINAGAFLAGSGSAVTLGGSGKNLSGTTTFNNLTVSGSYTASSDVTVNGAMTVSGAYQAGGTVLTLVGNLVNTGSLVSSGTITFTGTQPQTIGFNAGFNSSGLVNFNGTIAPGLIGTTSPTFQSVNINNASAIAPTVGWTINGTFTVATGASFIGGAATHTFKSNFLNNGLVTSAGELRFSPSAPATLALGGSSFVSSGLVVFGGTGQITLTGATPTLSSVEIANTHPAGVTPSANWLLAGDLIIDEDATLHGGSGLTMTVAGDWSDNGAFDGQTSTVIITGTADPLNGSAIAGIGSTTFNHLIIANGGLVAAEGDFNVAGNFTHNGSFDGTGGTVTFTGNTASIVGGANSPITFGALTVAKNAASAVLAADLTGLLDLTVASGTLDTATRVLSQDVAGGDLSIQAGATMKIGGTNTLPVFANYLFDPAGTVEYSGTGTQTITVENYGSLASSSTGARILPSVGTIGIAGSFTPGTNPYTVTGSTIDYNGAGGQTIAAFNYYNLTNSSPNARVLGTNSVIGIANRFTPGLSAYTIDGSTMNFNGAAQTLPAFTYYNLTVSGSGIKTLGGNITVNGSLSLAAGTLADAGFTATVNGDIDNQATHTGTGKILLSGGSTEHELSGSGSYNILELNDSQGALLSLTNLTVNSRLTFTSRNITTTTNKVIIGSTGVVARASGHVVGNLQKFVPNGATVTNSFEIGDDSSYAPVSVIVTNVTTTGNLIASTSPGDHPDIANSGLSETRGVNRYWTMTRAGIVFSNYTAVLNFVAEDIDAAAAPTNFVVGKKDVAGWTLPVVSNKTATNIFARGMTNFSDFAVAEPKPPPPIVTTQPQSQTANVGDTVQFSVEADPNGGGTLTYQWVLNGTNFIPGATGSTLVITNVQSSDAGTYTVIIDNGSVTNSIGAVLTVNGAPPTTQGIQLVGGNAQITFAGVPGGTYRVEATTNLNSPIFWSTVSTNVADSNGLFQFLDTQTKDFRQRYFRAANP